MGKKATAAASVEPIEDDGPEMAEREIVRVQPAAEVEQEPSAAKAIDLMRPQEETEEQRAYFAAQLEGHRGHGPKYANIEDFRRNRRDR